jgi:hypothetical protein
MADRFYGVARNAIGGMAPKDVTEGAARGATYARGAAAPVELRISDIAVESRSAAWREAPRAPRPACRAAQALEQRSIRGYLATKETNPIA